jgi:hypothetical protein
MSERRPEAELLLLLENSLDWIESERDAPSFSELIQGAKNAVEELIKILGLKEEIAAIDAAICEEPVGGAT